MSFFDLFGKKPKPMNYREILKLIITDKLDPILKTFNDTDKKKIEEYRDTVITNFNLTHSHFYHIFRDIVKDCVSVEMFTEEVQELAPRFREYMYRQWYWKNSPEPELKYYMTQRLLKNLHKEKHFKRVSWLIKDVKIEDVTPACYLAVDKPRESVYDNNNHFCGRRG